jgi:hypothetical protein
MGVVLSEVYGKSERKILPDNIQAYNLKVSAMISVTFILQLKFRKKNPHRFRLNNALT